ncbi:glycosyltransferase family 2 protein [Oribacterium sp. P6A1]|uniref:glycosyltransferase family 2 protein n=1 Tax=Oribacterium sp. P6A1 TaxID=1410612 RepID=UPI00068C1737|nr:glycosyltransferase [Oribacterium sp. P6A1]
MIKPTISVIITVYNREIFIEKCVKSILDQTEVSTEIILIDDGSTDHSKEICESFAALHENVRVIRQKNAGLSVARNTGLDNAIGDYICFLDDDDVMTPGSLKVLLEAMRKNDVDMVVVDFEKCKEDGSFLCSSHMPDNVKNRVITVDEYWTASFDKRGYFIFIVSWAKLYKK